MSRAANVCIRSRANRKPTGLAAILMLAVVPELAIAQSTASSSVQPAPSSIDWTLERVMIAALAQHPLVEAAHAKIEAARAERSRVDVLPNPVGTFWMENATFPGQGSVPGLNRETSAYVTIPLDPLLQRSSRVRRADEDVKTADAVMALARRQVAVEAARGFYRVALGQALADEAEEVRAALEQLAAFNRSRVDEGVTAEGELLRVQVELDRAATEVTVAEVELARSRAALQPYLGDVTLGGQPLASIHVAVPDRAVPVTSSIPALGLVLAEARAQRAELVAGRARTAAAAAAIEVERTMTVRQLGATIGNKRIGGANAHNSMIAAVSMTVPLFDRNRGGVERATRERVAAEHDVGWTERTVVAEVQGAYESADRWSRQLRDLQRSFLARADEVQRITLGAYQEGGATLLQVLDATRTRADARLTYTRALFAQLESLMGLALATGAEPADATDRVQTWTRGTPAPSAPPEGAR
jgi:cobalt-zinc-cadmium efflux system outer membrane protein